MFRVQNSMFRNQNSMFRNQNSMFRSQNSMFRSQNNMFKPRKGRGLEQYVSETQRKTLRKLTIFRDLWRNPKLRQRLEELGSGIKPLLGTWLRCGECVYIYIASLQLLFASHGSFMGSCFKRDDTAWEQERMKFPTEILLLFISYAK